ncbi:MAG TPA: transcriptional repressor LexA [Syntrophorhabdales bacterium]|nr:transcriptional repressor LexA [Syntrophorhabdales bacterium]
MGSETREKVLQFIRRFKEKKGYAPTVREIAEGCRISSPSVVQYHLDSLEQEGLISRAREKFRSINLTKEKDIEEHKQIEVPILGVIAAGHPVWVPPADTWDTASERIVVSTHLLARGKKNVYALRVRGNSMVDAMIADGDIVIMEPVKRVNNGDVVAAWLKNEQEITLKKIHFEGGQVRLQPCNPYMVPIYHRTDNVEIQGRVIAVIRVASA